MNAPESPRSPSIVLDLPAVSALAFAVSHELSGRSLVVRLSGSADSDVAPVLANFLERLHDEVLRTKVEDVALDFRELSFLTSSCIKYLVVAIKRLAATDAPSRYKLRLITSPTLRWQELSFEVLCQIDPGLVSIERA